MDVLFDSVVRLIAPVSLGLVFAASAAGKMMGREEFVGVVRNYRLLPEPAVRPFAYALPPIESAVAAGIVIGPTRPYAATAAVVLLAVFALAMSINIARGRRHIDCGCFRSSLRQPLSWWLVGRNGVLAGIALLGVPGVIPARALGWLDLVTAAGATIALFLAYLAASYVLGPAPASAALTTDGGRR